MNEHEKIDLFPISSGRIVPDKPNKKYIKPPIINQTPKPVYEKPKKKKKKKKIIVTGKRNMHKTTEEEEKRLILLMDYYGFKTKQSFYTATFNTLYNSNEKDIERSIKEIRKRQERMFK